MNLSENEKHLVRELATKSISNLKDFILNQHSFTPAINDAGHIAGDPKVNAGDEILIVEDVHGLVTGIKCFMSLCQRLDSHGLVQILENGVKKVGPKLFYMLDGRKTYANQILDLYNKNNEFEVIPNKGLGDFIENNFMTPQELNLLEERTARIKSQKLTLIVAITSLVISTLTSVGVAIFNYKTYTTERRVKIDNLDKITFPLEVKIIDEAPPHSSPNEKTSNKGVLLGHPQTP